MDLLVAGFDEVGRGCLVGPVIAAAVILDSQKPISGLADSKKLTARQRERLAISIKSNAIAWAIGRADASEIDDINILQASLLAMTRAFSMLQVKPNRARVDGNHFPNIDCPGEAIIQGDSKFSEISAASILAKVARDAEMATLDEIYKGYNFAKHKGYPTQLHLKKLQQLGVLPQHRKSFAPVQKYC
jgi:ribonuclease HII